MLKIKRLVFVVALYFLTEIECRKTRSTSTLGPALRNAIMNVNWTEENIEFQRIIDSRHPNHTFQFYTETILPTLKYQRGVNLTAYEINIRKEQEKIDVRINASVKDILQRERHWKKLRKEIKWIKGNITQVKRNILLSEKYNETKKKKDELMLDYRKLRKKYNLVSVVNNTYEFRYHWAKKLLLQKIKSHIRLYMNRTKHMYDFIMKKSEISDEVYDLKENITKLDMLINEELEEEFIYPNIKIMDVLKNLSDTIQSIPTKSYKYKKAKKHFKFFINIINKYLNTTRMLDMKDKVVIPNEVKLMKAKISELNKKLKISNISEIEQLKKKLKETDDEYQDVKWHYYRRKLGLRDVELERLHWEMNLTNFLKVPVRQDLIEAFYTPDIDFYLRDYPEWNVRDNVFLDGIRNNLYYKNYIVPQKTSTIPFELKEVLDLEDECKRYIHDNWFSLEEVKHPEAFKHLNRDMLHDRKRNTANRIERTNWN